MKNTDLKKLKKIVFKHSIILWILALIISGCAVKNKDHSTQTANPYNPISSIFWFLEILRDRNFLKKF